MDLSKIEPLGHMVLVRVSKGGRVGSIHLPDSARVERRAEVIAVGPGNVSPATGTRTPLGVQPGDVVVLHPLALPGTMRDEAKQGGQQSITLHRDGDAWWLLVMEGHILAIDRNTAADLVEAPKVTLQ